MSPTSREVQDEQGAHINAIYRGANGQTTAKIVEQSASRPKSRPRTRSSARAAGARFERSVADWLAAHVSEWIDRRVKTGARDCGDLANVRVHGGRRVVVECKDTARLDLAGWAAEAEAERVNDGAVAGVVVHKRHGVSDPGRQWVTMTVADFAALLTGHDVRDAAGLLATERNNG